MTNPDSPGYESIEFTGSEMIDLWSSPDWKRDAHDFGIARPADEADDLIFSIGGMETMMELIRLFIGARVLARAKAGNSPKKMLATISLKFDDDIDESPDEAALQRHRGGE